MKKNTALALCILISSHLALTSVHDNLDQLSNQEAIKSALLHQKFVKKSTEYRDEVYHAGVNDGKKHFSLRSFAGGTLAGTLVTVVIAYVLKTNSLL